MPLSVLSGWQSAEPSERYPTPAEDELLVYLLPRTPPASDPVLSPVEEFMQRYNAPTRGVPRR
ncbi:MAG: hypothetical protein NTY30_01940 [Candidatus Berkelbacteria bacterium]|nr:hypothetical protein [Candidatus Berkelbacteria bacterium]